KKRGELRNSILPRDYRVLLEIERNANQKRPFPPTNRIIGGPRPLGTILAEPRRVKPKITFADFTLRPVARVRRCGCWRVKKAGAAPLVAVCKNPLEIG